MQEDAQRKMEEAAINAERDVEKQNVILKLSQEVEEKAASIRANRTDNLGAIQRIAVIEGEKQTLASAVSDVSESIDEYNARLDAECQAEQEERRNRTPRTAELEADGKTLNERGKQVLQNDLEEIEAKYEALKKENENAVLSKTNKAQTQLKEKIIQDLNSLQSQSYELSSLTDDNLYFRVGNYDGTIGKEGWKYTLTVKLGGKNVYTDTGLLSYKEITGSKVPDTPHYSDKNYQEKQDLYNEYLDTVDSYDSFFRLNVPYIEVLVSYSVVADKPRYPSRYTVNVNNITFKNISTNSTIKNVSTSKSVKYQYTPSVYVDWTSADSDNTSEASNNTNNKTSASKSKKSNADNETSQQNWFSSIQEERNSFSFLIVPANINLYSNQGNEDNSYITVGYNLYFGLAKHLFVGANLELSPISMITYMFEFAIASLSDTTIINVNDADYMHLTLTAVLGTNLNLTKQLRLSAFGEVGVIASTLGLGYGGSLEFYIPSLSVGLYTGFANLYTIDSDNYFKISLGFEFVF